MEKKIKDILSASSSLKSKLSEDGAFISRVASVATAIKSRLSEGGTIYSMGNGGSTCDAIHLTEELVARYKRERPGIRAQHLMDGAVLTCWANDYDFETVFARQIQTFVTKKDIVIAFSTSGNSKNIIKGVEAAKSLGAYTVGFLGKDGGTIKNLVDIPLIIPSTETERIQEVHITLVHILCEILET